MGNVNLGSISGKIKKYCDTTPGKAKVKSQLTDRRGVNLVKYDGRMIPANEFAYMIAEDFYDELVDLGWEALPLPSQQSVRDNIANTTVTETPSCIGEYGDMYFWSVGLTIGGTDKKFLYRNSFRRSPEGTARTGDGVDNIVALFNNGVNASARVYGYWDGHGEGKYASAQTRPSLEFIQEAARNVVNRYKRLGYIISIEISGEYNNEGIPQTID